MKKPSILFAILTSGLMFPFGSPRAAQAAADQPPSVTVSRATASIRVDGRLDDPGWRGAAEVTTFYEASPGDNVTPPVRTTAWIMFDSKYLYVAFRCDDPDPSKIRAPYVDRDGIGADQDFVAVALDTRGDRQSALLLCVNPRGIQTDGVRNDATGDEDLSPDFFWDAATQTTASGWNVEMRIPFSSLRYTAWSLPHWGIFFYRNYPRAYRYQLFSVSVPRGSNCEVCHAMQLVGLEGLPVMSHLVVAPYVTGERQWAPAGDPGSALAGGPVRGETGVDVKWSPGTTNVADLTLNPDFSQVEADTAQITANKRFALFYPEKRPFFMEGVDLLQTPIQAAYTRTITAPLWGARATGTLAGVDYTLLTARDSGGGSVIIPGAQSSALAPQDFSSQASILRVRKTFGDSFVGFLVTDRENDDGSFNRVAGPDVQWRPSAADQITGQFLCSFTRTPERPDLCSQWDGSRLTGSDLVLSWSHNTRGWVWLAQYGDAATAFRADNGFVPQVGYRELNEQIGYQIYPSGMFSKVTPTILSGWYWDRHGNSLQGTFWPGVVLEGRGNLKADVFYKSDVVRAGTALLHTSRWYADGSLSPSVRVPAVSLAVTLGQDFDFVNDSVARGGDVTAGVTVRPGAHLGLRMDAEHQWLDSAREGVNGNLFTAEAGRLEGIWTFSAKSYLRAIAQYLATRRDPRLYPYPVSRKDGGLEASLLFSYQLNWQTALYVGYADQRVLLPTRSWAPDGRQVFIKLSYAFQR